MKFQITASVTFALVLMTSAPALSWDGRDSDSGTEITIERGNLVRSGNTIEIYEDGDYKEVDVQSIDSYGGTTEIEVYDYDSGEYRTFEMESE
jgi:hypothetical protein